MCLKLDLKHKVRKLSFHVPKESALHRGRRSTENLPFRKLANRAVTASDQLRLSEDDYRSLEGHLIAIASSRSLPTAGIPLQSGPSQGGASRPQALERHRLGESGDERPTSPGSRGCPFACA